MVEYFEGFDGTRLALHRLGVGTEPLLVAHAAGFSSGCYEPLAKRLSPSFTTFGLDARSHGLSKAPIDLAFSWDRYAKDVLFAIDHLDNKPKVGFGHSYGGGVLILAEQLRPGSFSHLILYEPVIFIDGRAGEPDTHIPLAKITLKRQDTFANYEELHNNFSGKRPMDKFPKESLAAFLRASFKKLDDGSYSLRCPKEHEAAIYTWGPAHNAFDYLPEMSTKVLYIYGEHTTDFPARHFEALASHTPGSKLVVAKNASHFGPFENPDQIAEIIKGFIDC